VTGSPAIATLDDAVARLVAAARLDPAATETIPLTDAIGRHVAEPIRLDRDHPPFDRATMDGIACRAADATPGAVLGIDRTIAAGTDPGTAPPPGAAVRIATGAAVPDGLDAVVERERLAALDEHRMRIELDDIRPGRHVHPRGADGRRGDVVVAAGTWLGAITLGVAAACGHDRPVVARRPRLAIVATGDELRAPSDPLDGPGDAFRIRDGNRPMLILTCRDLGAEIVADRRVADDLDATTTTIADLLATVDLVITIGGVSAGDRDFVPAAADRLGLHAMLRGVRIQPGRPASAWCDSAGRLRLAALPGNSVSCLVTTHLLIRPWIDARLGRDPAAAWCTIRLAEPATPNPSRTACRPAIATPSGAVVPAWNGSGDLPHVVGTHGLVRLPEQSTMIESGTELPWLPWTDSWSASFPGAASGCPAS